MNYQTPPQPPRYYGSDSYSVTNQVSAVMRKVYVRMLIGLLISAFCALGVASSPSMLMLIYSNQLVYWGMFIAMIVMAIVIPARLMKMSSTICLVLFCLFAALMGASLSCIFIVYSLGSIIYTFFITAGVFGAMSLYGYFTKADLTKIGSFCLMALFGLIIASVVNIFVASSTFDWIISIVGVLLFVGLTAWDTQYVKKMAQSNLDPALTDKLATMGAMNLYLDFVNLFLYLLRFFGNRN